jgi:Holliday junction resolvase-like predicted endonuclease
MFEQEIEMEQKEGGSIGPILMIVAMIGILVGGIGYMVLQNTRTLKPEEAAKVVTALIKAQPPTEVKFHAGKLASSMNDSLDRPQYKLLADAGVIKIQKDKKTNGGDIDLTAEGEKTITAIPEFKKKTEDDGTVAYAVPLATRKFVKIENITKLAANRFQVEYSWQWEPNALGEAFDISGKYIQSFNTWDRSQLIDKYGANYYHGEPTKVTVLIVKGENGWTVPKE